MSKTTSFGAYAAPVPGPLKARLSEKVAIVTGGGATRTLAEGAVGTGVAISRLFAADGCRVVIANRSVEPAERTLAAIKADGGEAIAVQADVSSAADCERVVTSALAAYGRLDIVVNNAGLTGDDEQWDAFMAVNVKAMVLMARAAVPHLPAGSAFVNVSSIAAFQPGSGGLGYATSKGAVLALTRAMALRWGFRGVRTNCIVPGSIWAPAAVRRHERLGRDSLQKFREARRLLNVLPIEGNGWDIAHAAAFLASDQSRWITGQSLIVDGGLTLWRHGTSRNTEI